MSTVPGPFHAVRWPLLSIAGALGAAGLCAMALTQGLSPSMAAAALVLALVLLLTGPPLEAAAGSLVLLLAIVLAAAAGYSLPLLLDQSPPGYGLWLLYSALGFLGIALGSFQAQAPRPFCYFPPLSHLSMHWSLLLVLWLAVEAFIGWRYGLPVLVQSIVTFAAGLIVGLGFRAGGLLTPRTEVSPEQIARGINKAQELIDQHKLPAARRRIDALLAAAPEDLAVRRMRYAAWKFEPASPAFHKSAADLLARSERDGGDQADITALYKDYLAVTQGRPKLPSDLHIKLARRFANWNDTENAANIVNLYLQRETNHPQLPDAILGLADAYVRTERFGRAEYFADTLITMIPNSGEAQMAQRLIRQIRQRQE